VKKLVDKELLWLLYNSFFIFLSYQLNKTNDDYDCETGMKKRNKKEKLLNQ